MWLRLQRTQVLDGGKIAAAIDYSLNAWTALTLHLDDGAVVIDTDAFDKGFRGFPLSLEGFPCPEAALFRTRRSFHRPFGLHTRGPALHRARV